MSDAVRKVPTLDEEMARFKSFATKDGEPSDGKPTESENKTMAARAAQRDASKKAQEADDEEARKAAAGEDADDEAEDQDDEADESEQDDAGESEGSDEKADEKAETKDDKGKKPKKSVQERINKAVAAQRRAERALDSERGRASAEIAGLRRDMEELRRSLTEGKRGVTSDPDKEPNPDDYEYGELDKGYLRALARYEVRQEQTAERARQGTRQSEAARQERADELAEKRAVLEESGRVKYDDFDEVVLANTYDRDSNPDGWPLSQEMAELIFDSEVGDDVAYALASDPKEAKRVFRLSPTAQAAYFGRLEAKFSSASDATAKGAAKPKPSVKTTKAPVPPANKARGSASGSTTVQPDTKDFKAFEASWAAQNRR